MAEKKLVPAPGLNEWTEAVEAEIASVTKKAIKWYNRIMNSIGYEHKTIGEAWSEDTENWNLRDMVAEMDYVLSCYYEDGHVLGDMRYGDYNERMIWRNETARIKRFIQAYKGRAMSMTCTAGHVSRLDNSGAKHFWDV